MLGGWNGQLIKQNSPKKWERNKVSCETGKRSDCCYYTCCRVSPNCCWATNRRYCVPRWKASDYHHGHLYKLSPMPPPFEYSLGWKLFSILNTSIVYTK
jgi:hypothetical protein